VPSDSPRVFWRPRLRRHIVVCRNSAAAGQPNNLQQHRKESRPAPSSSTRNFSLRSIDMAGPFEPDQPANPIRTLPASGGSKGSPRRVLAFLMRRRVGNCNFCLPLSMIIVRLTVGAHCGDRTAYCCLKRSISTPIAPAKVGSDASQPSLRNSCLRCRSVSEETFPF
jgi:hypothetical protein